MLKMGTFHGSEGNLQKSGENGQYPGGLLRQWSESVSFPISSDYRISEDFVP
jgi:hypothetical protein